MQTAMVVPSQPPAADQQADRAAAKQALRRLLRSARRDYVAGLRLDEQAELQSRLVDHLLPLLHGRHCLAIYAPMGSEIDPQMLMWHAGEAGIASAFPAFLDASSPMIFRSGRCAEDCPVGGVQPPHQAKQVEPDLVLVPLLAVDRSGNRLGQGGGHYDRALPALRANGARIIGVGWAVQLLDIALPAEPWDVRLDAFASPDGILEFK
ncbi:MAG: 5-formyltetrahydrofolate cyclo-ligase [Sphingomicrobium sp.]